MQPKNDYAACFTNGKTGNKRSLTRTQTTYLNQELIFLKEISSQIRCSAGANWFEVPNVPKAGLKRYPKLRPKK